MTEKQLLKRLQYQQNRLLDIKGYSFYLACHVLIITRYFIVFIHDANKNHNVIYKDHFTIKDLSLNKKLSELKDFVDGLFNN